MGKGMRDADRVGEELELVEQKGQEVASGHCQVPEGLHRGLQRHWGLIGK
jgi:hypothetical protein